MVRKRKENNMTMEHVTVELRNDDGIGVFINGEKQVGIALFKGRDSEISVHLTAGRSEHQWMRMLGTAKPHPKYGEPSFEMYTDNPREKNDE